MDQHPMHNREISTFRLRVVDTKNYSDPLLLSTATTESGVRLGCLGWHLKPISDYLSTFLHFQNAAYLVKNQYKPITSFKVNTKSNVRLFPDGILSPSLCSFHFQKRLQNLAYGSLPSIGLSRWHLKPIPINNLESSV